MADLARRATSVCTKFHRDRLRNGWDITLWNFAKTRTNTQTDMGITIPRPPPMGGEVIINKILVPELNFFEITKLSKSNAYNLTVYLFCIYGNANQIILYYGPEGRPYSNQCVRPFVCSFVCLLVIDYFCWRIVVCVRFSPETTWPISSMMIPINWGNNVDVQRTLHFDLDPSMTAGQGHEILRFWEFRCLTGSTVVCVRFSSETTWPISPMMIPINWGNNVDVQHALHFDLHPSMTAGQGHKILWFCEFRCLMGSSLCLLLLRT